MLAAVLATTIAALCCASTVAGGRINIIGGDVTKTPISYMAILRSADETHLRCGGVLIAPRHVLTAASCLHSSLSYVTIGGVVHSGQDGERHAIDRTIPHPNAIVTILELANRSKLAPVRIDWEDAMTPPGTFAWGLGFGGTANYSYSLSLSPLLKEVAMSIWTDRDCEAHFGWHDDFILCAGDKLHSMCYYDDGGPLVVRKNGEDFLRGIALWTDGCGVLGMPNAFGRIHAIREFLVPFLTPERNENPPPVTLEPRPTKLPPSDAPQ